MRQESLDSRLYGKVLDELEMVFSHKPFQILFYGSWERGDATPDSDLNFFLLAHSTDQMKGSFVESISQALQPLETVAPVNMIAGDAESLRLRMKLFEPACIHLLEEGSNFFGENLLDGLRSEWSHVQSRGIPKKELVQYLQKRIRFFKQQTTRNLKEEISQLERIATLSLQIWALENVEDLSLPEILKLDTPNQIGPMMNALYGAMMSRTEKTLLSLALDIYETRRKVRWKRDVSREAMHSLKQRLMGLRRENQEELVDLWA